MDRRVNSSGSGTEIVYAPRSDYPWRVRKILKAFAKPPGQPGTR